MHSSDKVCELFNAIACCETLETVTWILQWNLRAVITLDWQPLVDASV